MDATSLLSRVVIAYQDCDGHRGAFSCTEPHDLRCPKARAATAAGWKGEWTCQCGREELDAALAEAEAFLLGRAAPTRTVEALRGDRLLREIDDLRRSHEIVDRENDHLLGAVALVLDQQTTAYGPGGDALTMSRLVPAAAIHALKAVYDAARAAADWGAE